MLTQFCTAQKSSCRVITFFTGNPRGALHIFRVRGRAIGKGIDFPDIGIKNGINFHNFSMSNGTDFQNFRMKYKAGYTFSKYWYKERVYFFKKLVLVTGMFSSLDGTSPTNIWSSATPGRQYYRINFARSLKILDLFHKLLVQEA